VTDQITDYSVLEIDVIDAPPATANFSIGMVLADSDKVPLDVVYRNLTKGTWASALSSASDEYAWFQQAYTDANPARVMIGRWIKTASYSYVVFPLAESGYAVWAALAATAKVEVDDGTNTEDISPDFTGDTSMADVAASFTAAFVASTSFTGWTAAIDALDRLYFLTDDQGTAAPTVTIGTPGSGVDLSGSAYLGTALFVDGLDAEDPEDALTRVLGKTNDPFAIDVIGASIAQEVSLSTAVNAMSKICLFRNTDPNAIISGATTDTGYQCEALGHKNTYIVYTEHTTQYPPAAIVGQLLTKTIGTYSFAINPITGLSQSGLSSAGAVEALTADQKLVLAAKGYDWVEKPANSAIFTHGLAVAGNEMRIRIAEFWAEYDVSLKNYAYMEAQDVVTYSDTDLQAFKMNTESTMDILVGRKVLDEGYTITFPLASSFNSTTRATHEMDVGNVGTLGKQDSVNKISIQLTWS
jgi:hypothetical protein